MSPMTFHIGRAGRGRPPSSAAPSTHRTVRRPARALAGIATAFACAAALLTGLTAPAHARTTARVDNPYAGATVYVNPDWSAHAAAEPGGAAVAGQPTAVWLDSIAAISGSGSRMGLREHLDAALEQGADVVQLVLYDLPGRDCERAYSTGELGPDEIGRYESEFVDPIAAIISDPAYASLRIVTIVEPNSLDNLVVHTTPRAQSTFACDTMKANGGYVNGIGYALATLGAESHVYAYLDASYHGEIGWDDDARPTLDMLATAARARGASPQNVAGFIVNTANYGVLHEEYFTTTDTVNGVSVQQSKWVDWNPFIEELPFGTLLRQSAVNVGFTASVGILVDTSRNGWGGPDRPTGPGPKTGSVDDYVDAGRLDRRPTVNSWCNQDGAGLGERPVASPQQGIDAYVWAKEPGVSDGTSANIPDLGLSNECDPEGLAGWPHDSLPPPTNALPNSPVYGEWFPAAFHQLLANAWPAV